MSELAREREALSRACVKAMRAKGLSFKRLADKIGVSSFITAAALLRANGLTERGCRQGGKGTGH
jgi:cyanate lyase